jgi:hypothetical protein
MIYLTIWVAIRWHSTVHIYTQTIHRTTKTKQYTEQHKNLGRERAVPHLGELYPGICLTTEEKLYFSGLGNITHPPPQFFIYLFSCIQPVLHRLVYNGLFTVLFFLLCLVTSSIILVVRVWSLFDCSCSLWYVFG